MVSWATRTDRGDRRMPSQGWGGHFQQYSAIPEPMPVAVV
jgi:hypothetical protein